MANDWSNRNDRAEDSDKFTAATLAAALIARGFTLPAATNTTMAAAQAVELYRSVLSKLGSLDPDENAVPRIRQSESPLVLEEMRTAGVTTDGAKYRYQTYLYEKLDDALRYARLDRSRQDKDKDKAGDHAH